MKRILGALFCCALWGSAAPFIKLGYQLLDISSSSTGSIILFAGTRFFLAGILVLVFLALSKKSLKPAMFSKNDLGCIAVLALFQTIGQYFFYYMGLAHSSAVIGAVLSGTSAFIALLLSAYVFHLEKGTFIKIFGCILGFLGILILNLDGLEFQIGIGEVMLLLSQVSSALSAICIQIFSRKHDPVLLSGWQFTTGGLVLMLAGALLGGTISWNLSGILVLLWLALVSALAYTLWGILLARYPVSSISIFGCTIPIFGVLFSWVILQENQAFSWQTLISLGLITAGVLLLNSPISPENICRKRSRS